jgi:hypothetical protein
MPFDDIRVKLRVRRVLEAGVDLESSFFRSTAGGAETKIAVGKLGGAWLQRREGVLVPASIPEKLLKALTHRRDGATQGLRPPGALAIAGARPAAAKEPD